MAERPLRVGITRDNLGPDGKPIFPDSVLSMLDHPRIEWEFMPVFETEMTAETAARYDAVCAMLTKITLATLRRNDLRLRLVARFGVGYDTIDVPACTERGVMLTIAPDGVRTPVATCALTFVLALSQHIRTKDRIVREGRWDARTNHMGIGLEGRVLGSIGVGNIGGEMYRLARPLGMRHIAHDPFQTPEQVAGLGIELVDMETVLRDSDFLCVHCPLNEQTRGLVDAAKLAKMKPTAFLINTARGPIVDEGALYRALVDGTIAGAGLDVFEQEPTPPDNPILTLDNVLVTPHAFCFTDECLEGLARSAFNAVRALADNATPNYVVNQPVLDHPKVRPLIGR
jgi:D-3-phosphoglycerate dehydrogenase